MLLILVVAFHFIKTAVVFITFSLVLLLFIINVTILIINIIKKNKRTLKKRIISIILPNIGIIISVLLLFPYLKLFYKIDYDQTKVQRGIINFDELKEKAGVNTIIFWNEDASESGIQKYFIYENKKYIKFDTFSTRDVDFKVSDIRDTEINKLAGIILDEDQEKDTFFNGLFNVLFPAEATERVLYKYVYTVKNCNDKSLLIVKRHFYYNNELFCDEEDYFDKYNYYNDIYNYNIIISKSDSNTYMFNKFYYIDGMKVVIAIYQRIVSTF
jgi:amino acid transporter